MKRVAGLALPLFLWTGLGAATYCTRIFHSAIINNQTLYIDGGEIRDINAKQEIEVSVPYNLLAIDLSKSWSNSDSDLFTSIPKPFNRTRVNKNAKNINDYPQILNEGASFSDGSNLYLYGGYLSGGLNSDIAPEVATWKYDIEEDSWTSNGFGGRPIVRLSEGATAQSTVNKKAYYLGGMLNPGGNPNYGTEGASPYSDSGLIVLDQETLKWENYSSESINNFGTINDGYMNIIENIGDDGILVAFGGNKRPVGGPVSLLASSVHENEKNSMQNISVYDIANDAWYIQQATGDIPSWRMSGCSVMAPAQDLSSFSIYVYGGVNNDTSTSNPNIYVLSLPSFRWVKLDGEESLRIKHKCQLAGDHQMIVVGGTVPTKSSEYDSTQANCDSGQFEQGIGIFDINTHQWSVGYTPDNEKYAVHSSITKVIGGSKSGGATLTQPQKGWADKSLGSVFGKKRAISTAQASSSPSASPSSSGASSSDGKSKSISGGGIAGATVGAVAGAAAIIGAAFFAVMYRRRRAAKQGQNTNSPPDGGEYYAELHDKDRPFELASTSDAPVEMPAKESGFPTEMPANSINTDPSLSPQELPADHTMHAHSPQSRQ